MKGQWRGRSYFFGAARIAQVHPKVNAKGKHTGWYATGAWGDFFLNTENDPVESFALAVKRVEQWIAQVMP